MTQQNDSQWNQVIDLGKKFTTIILSPQHTINGFQGMEPLTLSRKQNYTIVPHQIDSLIHEVEKELNTRGLYFNTIQITEVDITNASNVTAKLKINSSSKRIINDITIKGYPKFPDQQIKRLINRKLTLNTENVNKIETAIKVQNTATIEKPSEILYKKDSTKLFLYLAKKKINRVEGMLGLNNSNAAGRTEINGYLDLELNNNLNKAERLNIVYRNDGNEITNIDAQLRIPNLIFNRAGIRSGLLISRRDSIYSNTTFNAGVFISSPIHHTVGVNYINYKSTDTRTAIASEDITTNGLNAEYHYTKATENYSILMYEGTSLGLKIGHQERMISEKLNNQLIINATFSKLWHLSNRMKIYNLLNSGILDSQDLRLNELYQIGGLNSIRGFAQNTIDTSKYVTLLNEFRWSLNDQIYLYSITDLAFFENFQTLKTEKLYGLGAGIAILTQSGIVTFSLANGSFENANLGLSSLVAHINLRISF
jgi:outer membrane protein assembly factor BamA